MALSDQWQWQTPQTSWKGIGIYHVTLTVTSRQPLLGELVIPADHPEGAKVDLTEFGKAIKACVRQIPILHPEITIIALRMMPDHVHAALYVKHPMPVSIKAVVRGFWQGARKVGRDYSLSISPQTMRDKEQCLPDPIFHEMPFIRPLSRRGQLDTMIKYIKHNPQRLAVKRLKPGFFHVQPDIHIAGYKCSGVGNAVLLFQERYAAVHVRHTIESAALQGDDQPLRDYMNSCVLAAREGAVMVGAFISKAEKRILEVLLREQRPVIYLADNGFRDYYKPPQELFDPCATGRLLILSPWEHDPAKRHISREDCVFLNTMAETIAGA